ncbi:MAG: M23 family metallopeptidase [Myxococcota bacterium]|nr:M23 family metallopeptidase [Myxococcota bacterium]MDW8362189.1 M23 family metallopeptidase [Myxococcales bacterium]
MDRPDRWGASLALSSWLVVTGGATHAARAEAEDPGEECNLAIPAELHALLAEEAHVLDASVAGRNDLGASAEAGLTTTGVVSGPDAAPAELVWDPEPGRGCHRYRGRRVCEGPRRRPLAHGPDAERAARLGLGTATAVVRLEREGTPEAWLAELAAASARAPAVSLPWPVDGGRLWRGFGRVGRGRRARIHEGIDIGAPEGALVRAVADGLVVYSDNGLSGYGNLVVLLHADGSSSRYGHLSAAFVFAGQIVRQGTPIGAVGDTGLARGHHLHFEWHVGGRPRDPLLRMAEPLSAQSRNRSSRDRPES